MSERFFSSSPITSESVLLDGAEAHHLLHVMRMAVGQRVTLFDDSGAEFDAVVDELRRRDARLRIVARRELDRELPFPLDVGVVLPKGDRQKWLVEKLTELGVVTLVPLVTERGVAQPSGGALDRLRRTVIEGSKQCGRNRLMRIASPQTWADWIADPQTTIAGDLRSPDPPPTPHRLIAHPGGRPLAAITLQPPAAAQIAIGPEGGFSEAELEAALAAGWQQVDLGPRILRVETAAVALVATIGQSMHPSRA